MSAGHISEVSGLGHLDVVLAVTLATVGCSENSFLPLDKIDLLPELFLPFIFLTTPRQ